MWAEKIVDYCGKKMKNRKRISSLGKSVKVFTKNGKRGILWKKGNKTKQLNTKRRWGKIEGLKGTYYKFNDTQKGFCSDSGNI